MMKLYYSPNACSLSPHIVLRECGIPFKMERVDLRRKKTESGLDFYKINPKGYIPVLELEDGTLLTEGTAMVQYIADKAPKAQLAPPAGTMERYRIQEWLNFIATEIHKNFGALFQEATPAEYKSIIIQKLKTRFDYLEKHFAKHAFLGQNFTIADAYLFTTARWSDFVKLDLKPWPSLMSFIERVNSRPAVQTALHAEEVGK